MFDIESTEKQNQFSNRNSKTPNNKNINSARVAQTPKSGVAVSRISFGKSGKSKIESSKGGNETDEEKVHIMSSETTDSFV